VGVAVAAGDVIVVPVVRAPIGRGVAEIARELAGLTARGRERKLAPDEVAGATITLSNVGGTEIASASTIINPPQVAMIAVTRIVDRVVPVDGMIAVRPMLNASFTYDHRVVQGVPGARFAERFKHYLEHPEELDA
jgi:pyruvate dehydrogenase E2 component (dihydrolipoamide acetyltransferase)